MDREQASTTRKNKIKRLKTTTTTTTTTKKKSFKDIYDENERYHSAIIFPFCYCLFLTLLS
jgi:hypothetical protein